MLSQNRSVRATETAPGRINLLVVMHQSLGSVCEALHEVFKHIPEYGNDGFVCRNEFPRLGVDINEKVALKYPPSHPVAPRIQPRNYGGSLQTP